MHELGKRTVPSKLKSKRRSATSHSLTSTNRHQRRQRRAAHGDLNARALSCKCAGKTCLLSLAHAAWGIEIGDYAIKAIRLERAGKDVEVSDFAVIPHRKVLTTPDVDV